MTEADRDFRITRDVAAVLARQAGVGEPELVNRPEVEDRHNKAVEAVFRIGDAEHAFEHTAVMPLVGQQRQQAHIVRLIPRAGVELGVNDRYAELVIAYDAFDGKGVKGARQRAQARAEDLCQRAAAVAVTADLQALGSGRSTVEEVETWDGGSARVRVVAADDTYPQVGRLHLVLAGPADVDDHRRTTMRKALADKVPKLLAERELGRVTVLVIEVSEIFLSNNTLVVDALQEAARIDGVDLPDMIVLACYVAGLRRGTVLYASGTWAEDSGYHDDFELPLLD